MGKEKIEELQNFAIQAGVPQEHLDRFTTYVQVRAYERLRNIEDALLFTNTEQIKALYVRGTTAEGALKIQNFFQLKALRLGATAEEASQFSNNIQVGALRNGATPEEALQVTIPEESRVVENMETLDLGGAPAEEPESPEVVGACGTYEATG